MSSRWRWHSCTCCTHVRSWPQSHGHCTSPRTELAASTCCPALCPRRSLAHKLPMPVLLLWADGDVALGPQLLSGTEKHAERLTVRIVQDCSHWMQQDRWQEVNALLREFLAT